MHVNVMKRVFSAEPQRRNDLTFLTIYHLTLEFVLNLAAIRFLQRVLSVFPAPKTTILSTEALIRAIAVLLIGWVNSLR